MECYKRNAKKLKREIHCNSIKRIDFSYKNRCHSVIDLSLKHTGKGASVILRFVMLQEQ